MKPVFGYSPEPLFKILNVFPICEYYYVGVMFLKNMLADFFEVRMNEWFSACEIKNMTTQIIYRINAFYDIGTWHNGLIIWIGAKQAMPARHIALIRDMKPAFFHVI